MQKKSSQAKRSDGVRPHRKVTGMNLSTKDDVKMCTIVGRAAKFFTEGLWMSMYGRIYRDVVISQDSLSQAGDIAWRVLEAVSGFETNLEQRDRAVAMFRLEVARVLSLDPAARSMSDQNFIIALLRQRSKVRDVLTAA